MNTYRRIVLAERPRGEITSQCFRLETVPVPDLKPGQILVKNHFLVVVLCSRHGLLVLYDIVDTDT